MKIFRNNAVFVYSSPFFCSQPRNRRFFIFLCAASLFLCWWFLSLYCGNRNFIYKWAHIINYGRYFSSFFFSLSSGTLFMVIMLLVALFLLLSTFFWLENLNCERWNEWKVKLSTWRIFIIFNFLAFHF